MNILFMFIINCILAAIVSMCIFDCESHEAYFMVHPDLTKNITWYENHPKYKELVDQYKRLQDEWKPLEGATYAKVCVSITTFIAFALRPTISVLTYPEKSTAIKLLTLIVPVIVPTILMHLFVNYINKQMLHYRKFMHTGKGQKGSVLPISIIKNIEACCYIENIDFVSKDLTDIDYTIARLETRIAYIKHSQIIYNKSVVRWLKLSTTLATFLIWITFYSVISR